MTARPDLWRDLAAVFDAAASPRLPLDEWAAKYRRVVGGPRPGPWNPANAPMSLEPMRAVSDRRVAQVTICAPAQLLKSEFCINCAVKTAADGDDVLFYEPDRAVLAEFMRDRIKPAVSGLAEGVIAETSTDKRKKRDSAMVFVPQRARFSEGTCLLELCEANIGADATANPEYSLSNSSAPAGSKQNPETSCVLANLFVACRCMSRLHRQIPADWN